MARFPDKPENCTEVATYAGSRWYADGWVRGDLGNVIVVGQAGVGKTETMTRTAGPNHLLVQGQASGVNVYQRIFDWVAVQRNSGAIIIDDADPLFRTLSGQSFMKEVMLDKPDRRVSWGTDYSKLAKNDIPLQFTMSNPVCVIINRWKTFNEHLAAIENRANLLYVNFSAQEVHKYVGSWFLKSPEADLVYNFVGRFLPLIPQPNIREYYEGPLKVLTAEGALGRPNPEGNWQRLILNKLLKRSEVETALLVCDDYPSNAQRAKAFEERGYGTTRTFYRHIKKLKLGDRQECEQAIAALDAEEERLKAEQEPPTLTPNVFRTV